jgi:hypothetical protein
MFGVFATVVIPLRSRSYDGQHIPAVLPFVLPVVCPCPLVLTRMYRAARFTVPLVSKNAGVFTLPTQLLGVGLP